MTGLPCGTQLSALVIQSHPSALATATQLGTLLLTRFCGSTTVHRARTEAERKRAEFIIKGQRIPYYLSRTVLAYAVKARSGSDDEGRAAGYWNSADPHMSDDNVMDLRSSMHRDPSVSQLLETSSLVSVDGSSGSASHIDWAESVDESDRSGHDADPVDDSESSRSMMGWSVVSHRAPVGSGRGRASGLWGSALLPLGGHSGDHDDAAKHNAERAAATSAGTPTRSNRAAGASEEGRLRRRAQLHRCARAVLIVAALAAFSGCVVYALEFYILPGEVIGRLLGEGRMLPREYSKDLIDEERMRRVEERRKRRAKQAGIRQRVTYRRAMVWDTTGPYIPQD